MNASIDWSRAISPILSVANWLIVTLSGLMPDSFRITRSSVTLDCVRPITPTRWPASSSRLLILGVGCFFEPLAGRPEGAHSTTTFLRRMATDSALSGRFRSPRATARSALPAVNQRDALRRPFRRRPATGRTEAVFARERLRHQLDQFLVFAAGRPDRNPQRRRPQHVIQRAGGNAEGEHAGGKDQERIALPLPPPAGSRRIVVRV